MARYGDYDGLRRETERARYVNGLEPVHKCEKCRDDLYYGDRVYDFDGEIYCPDCALDKFNEWERYINDKDIEEE